MSIGVNGLSGLSGGPWPALPQQPMVRPELAQMRGLGGLPSPQRAQPWSGPMPPWRQALFGALMPQMPPALPGMAQQQTPPPAPPAPAPVPAAAQPAANPMQDWLAMYGNIGV